MKKRSKIMMMVFTIALVVTFLPVSNVNAAKKKGTKKVTYTFKKGTLTIKGKGKMPSKMTFKNNKKIKKVVIKKGVTSISNRAFYKCKNLSKVTISKTVTSIGTESFCGTKIKSITVPDKVKTIGQNAFGNCKKLKTLKLPGKYKVKMLKGDEMFENIMGGSCADTVYFTTALDLKTVPYVNAKAFKVSNQDSKYTSKSGVIYSKDGKAIVRVPKKTKELIIEDGCETFALQSILYGLDDYDGDIVPSCNVLEKIRIPASVRKIDLTAYTAGDAIHAFEEPKDVVISAKDMDADSIVNLCNCTNTATLASVAKQISSIQVENGTYISKENVLLGYEGKAGKLVIPEGVKAIAEQAVQYCGSNISDETLTEVIMPDTVTKVGKRAFYGRQKLQKVQFSGNLTTVGDEAFAICGMKNIQVPGTVTKWGKDVFSCNAAEEVILPKNMREIPEGMFDACSALKSIDIPDTVAVIGERAFCNCGHLEKITFGKGVRTIKTSAFANTGLKELMIPAYVEKVGQSAFCRCDKAKKIIIEGKTAIDGSAFCDCGNVVLDYRAGAGLNQTSISLETLRQYQKKYIVSDVSWMRVKGVSGYEIKVATDKKFKKNVKVVNVHETSHSKKIKMKVKKIKDVKKVYVQIRPYTNVNGTKVYGKTSTDMMGWSI